jgi:excinuclease ABC subunit C
LHRLNLDSLPLLGLAKRLEEIYLPDKSEPIVLPRTNSALVLLQRIRNEAHRFAISYHRRLRNRETLHLGLADIPGLGKNKQQNLIKFFKSISKMRAASIEDLCQVQGIGPELARKVYIYLHR